MTTQSHKTNSQPKLDIIPSNTSIPQWALDRLADYCDQHQQNESNGEIRITISRGRIKKIYNTTEAFAPSDSQELRAVKKQAS